MVSAILSHDCPEFTGLTLNRDLHWEDCLGQAYEGDLPMKQIFSGIRSGFRPFPNVLRELIFLGTITGLCGPPWISLCPQAEICSHQTPYHGLFRGMDSFLSFRDFMPDGCCRSVETANICCNRKNLGEENA